MKEKPRNRKDKAGDRNIQSETDTVKQRQRAANEECSNAGGHWHPFSWHARMPSCRIYPGALGLHCEKTQSA